jgi:hypothetical protein
VPGQRYLLFSLSALALLLLLPSCSPVEPPVVQVAALSDTTDTVGPYAVAAVVTARRPIGKVALVWHNAAVGPGQAVHVAMVEDDLGVWRAAIPGSGRGAVIAYHVEAEDSSGDRGYAPPDTASGVGCAQEYCFSVLPAP